MSTLKKANLVNSIADALDRLDAMGTLLSDADLPSNDLLMEECDILEAALRNLGVVHPQRVLEHLPETVEEVTDKRIATILRALEFDSEQRALDAQAQAKALHLPLKRVIRAARVNRAVVLASIQSRRCLGWIAGAAVDWARSN